MKLIWFLENFNRFPARAQVMFGILAIEIACVILLLLTSSAVWVVAVFILVAAFYITKGVKWGGKDLDTVLQETVEKWDKEDEEKTQ